MGQNGMDVKLSEAARELFPFSVECKALQKFAIYNHYEQACSNAEGLTPIAVIKGNRCKPLVVIDLDDFMELL